MQPGRLACVAALALGLAGCGHGSGGTRLTVEIRSGQPPETHRYSLSCHPPGGTMPRAAALCRAIAAHPAAMLDPADSRSTCIGGFAQPVVHVTGRAAGRGVDLSGTPFCDWPGGTALGAYWLAADRPDELAPVLGRVRCDDDAALLVAQTPWKRVRACLD